MAFSVRGKTAIVTGAGSGIGLAFARLLLQSGCNVLIADLALKAEAEYLVKTFALRKPAEANGESEGSKVGTAVFQRTDVTRWEELERMFSACKTHFGVSADIVCPGAGIFEPLWSNFWRPPGSVASADQPNSNHYQILDINLTHPIRTAQLAIANFLQHHRAGSIVFISSMSGREPFFGAPMYVATKHALTGFVRSLADLEFPPLPSCSKEWNADTAYIHPIRVTAVAPGRTQTPLWTDHTEKMQWIKDKAGGGWIAPDEVAIAMVDLIRNPSHVGGTIIEIPAPGIWHVANECSSTVQGQASPAEPTLSHDVWESLRRGSVK